MRQSTSGLPTNKPELVDLRQRQHADLTPLNSFGCPATAGSFVQLSRDTPDAIAQAVRWIDGFENGLILGGGTNLLFATDQIPAVLQVALPGRARLPGQNAETPIVVRAAAGESWHEFVLWSLAEGYSGLENLALIPGTVGAAPVQNIGAYGVELASLVHSVEVFDRHSHQPGLLSVNDCGFGYRDSEFKRQPERWLITAVRFSLHQTPKLMLDYGDIRQELASQRITQPTPADVAQAVTNIRRRKLPDPKVLGNAGSFFKNPIVLPEQASQLRKRWPDMPCFEVAPQTYKLAAGWLIEQCGLKGFRAGDAGVHESHALVLVNYGRASGQQVLALADQIVRQVRQRFGIELEPEPRIIRPA